MKKTLNATLHIIRMIFAWILQMILSVIPINEKYIILYAHERKGVCCNPKYIMKGIEKEYPGEYEFYWVSEYPDTVPTDSYYHVIKKRSFRYFYYFAKSKYYIFNDMADEVLRKKSGQIFINCWHGGGAIKKAGYDIVDINDRRQVSLFDKWYLRTDFMVIPNMFLVEQFKRAFKLKYQQMILSGMPRSDIFYTENDFYYDVRKKYQIDRDKKILLYAPTYRMRGENLIKKNELKDIVRELEKKTNYRWVVFYRAHQFEKEKAIYDDDIINCTDYADVQEILIASDLLISDYSSLMSDYSELERPIISYIPDYEKYMTTERSFYIPCNEWPYMVAKSINEIIWEIWNYDKEKYIKRLRLFKDKLGYLGNGESTQMFIRSILGI